MLRLSILISLSLLACPAPRAQSVVLPASAAAAEGARIAGEPFGADVGRNQWIVHGDQLRALGTPWQVSEVWFRRDMTRVRPLPGGVLDVEIWASETSAAHQGPASTFAANHGGDHRLRFAQRVVFPASSAAGPIPAAWDESQGQALRFVLAPPVVSQSGGNLCLDVITRAVPGQPPPQWDVDGVWSAERGSSTPYGSSCAVGGLVPVASALDGFSFPGSTAMLGLSQVPAGRLVAHGLGFSSTSWGGIALPLALDSAGAPGCALYTECADLFATTTTHPAPGAPSGHALRVLPLPLDPALLAARFTTQWFVFDPAVNALGLATSHGLRVQLAAGFPSFAVATVYSTSADASQGRVLQHAVPVLRLVR